MSDRPYSYCRNTYVRFSGKVASWPGDTKSTHLRKKGVRTCVKKRRRRRRTTSAGKNGNPREEKRTEITNEPPLLSRKYKEEEENLYYVGAPRRTRELGFAQGYFCLESYYIVQGDIFVLPCSKGFKIANAETGLLFMNFQRISFCSVTE